MYIRNKRVKAVLLTTIFCITYLFTYTSYIKPLTVYAATTGIVNGTGVNVRTGPTTSESIITKLTIGDQVTILDTVQTSDTYAWYHIEFNLNGNNTVGYITSQYVTVNSDSTPIPPADTDFEAYMNAQGFPESYKNGLRDLHNKYPKWVFRADTVSYDWNAVVSAESKIGKSLISGTSIDSWKSMAPGAYDYSTGTWISFDSGNWVTASQALVSYALDPRNFLNSTNVFMFEDLGYDESLQTETGINSIISNTFMQSVCNIGDNSWLEFAEVEYKSYATALMKAAQMSGVSPYHLATRIIQEMGSAGLSDSISGTTSAYPGFYNYYNWNAYASGGLSAIMNGLKYATAEDYDATLRPWSTRMRSIIGGAKKLGNEYINRGQNNLYYQKFDLISPYTHQYMTNILAAKSESTTAAKAYSESMKSSESLVFRIPVYQNMPGGICEIPTGTQSSNNYLNSLSVSNTGLTPTFNYATTNYDVIVDNSIATISVSAEPKVSSASVSGVQAFNLNVGSNTINIVVTAENGDTRTYTINVVRNSGSNSGPGDESGSMSPNAYVVNESAKEISGVSVGSSAAEILGGFSFTGSYSGRIVNPDGSDNNGKICTGNRLVVTNGSGNTVSDYTFVVYGDVNGDGEISSMDLAYVKRHILGGRALEGAYALAGDANRAGDSITSLDLAYIKRAVLGGRSIVQ